MSRCTTCEFKEVPSVNFPCVKCLNGDNDYYSKKLVDEPIVIKNCNGVHILKDNITIDIDGTTIVTEHLYKVIEQEFDGLDAIYEDAIIHHIGEYGLNLLLIHKRLESCGVSNCRKLYTLCKPKGLS